MQPSPSFAIDLPRCAVWRGTVIASAVVAGAALLAWALSSGNHQEVVACVSAALMFAVLATTASLLRSIGPARLQWDGRDWSLEQTAAISGSSRRTGRLSVMLDLGAFLLLRLDEPGAGLGRRQAWIPVSRRGCEAHWHGLRCAVYCARPSHDGPADPAR